MGRGVDTAWAAGAMSVVAAADRFSRCLSGCKPCWSGAAVAVLVGDVATAKGSRLGAGVTCGAAAESCDPWADEVSVVALRAGWSAAKSSGGAMTGAAVNCDNSDAAVARVAG